MSNHTYNVLYFYITLRRSRSVTIAHFPNTYSLCALSTSLKRFLYIRAFEVMNLQYQKRYSIH